MKTEHGNIIGLHWFLIYRSICRDISLRELRIIAVFACRLDYAFCRVGAIKKDLFRSGIRLSDDVSFISNRSRE